MNFWSIFIFTLSLSLSSTYFEAIAQKDNRPNILIILTDDQGYYDVSACGAEDLVTPNMDLLFEDGMKFNFFYANSPVCSPTRASLITGLYPDKAGVPGVIRTHVSNSWGNLKEDATTMGEVFQKNGYHTALIGKWHLGLRSPNTPNEKGFQYFKGFLGDMMDDYWSHLRHGNNYMRENEKIIDPEGHATDLFSKWAVDFIKDQKKKSKPFLLYLAYNAPHFPVQPPKDWLDKVKKRNPNLSERRARLVAFIEHLDKGIGDVITALKNSGQYENTIIIFTSDNGGLLRDEANNGPLRDGKQSVYEGGLRVPTCFIWNGNIASGSSTDHKAVTMDIFPTICDLVDIDLNQNIDGVSIAPVLFGDEEALSDRILYFVRREGGTRYGGLTIQAIIKNDWKLLQNNPFEAQELYNIKEDPYENFNLIVSEPDIYNELNQLMMKQIQEGGKTSWQAP